MKTFSLAAALIIAAFLAAPTAQAATGTWTAVTGSPANWSLATNWSGSIIADGASSAANFTANITGSYTVNLDTSRTIGSVVIGDSNSSNAYTIATGSNTLTFDNGASNAALTQNGNGTGDIVSGKLAIGGNGTLVVSGSKGFASFTVSAGITSALTTGTQTLSINNNALSHTVNFTGSIADGSSGGKIAVSKAGAGTATINFANTYTGGTTLSGGTLNVNNASALGTGALTITGGTLNNTTASAITLSSNIAQNWNGSFGFGGTRALNLGMGAVTLGANVTTTVNGSNALTVGGDISGSGKSLTKAGVGSLILGGTNTYDGGTTINGGVLLFNTSGSIAGSGQNVTVNNAGAAAFGFALDQATLTGRLVSGSAGTVALAADSANNLNLGAAGLTKLSLGAANGTWTYSGTAWTPAEGIYRLGGGGGTLVFNPALTGANSLLVGGNTNAGTVTLANAGTYSGATTVTGGIGSTSLGSVGGASLLQTNVLSGSSTTPFGSNTSITLNNGGLGLGTAGSGLSAGDVMNVAGYDLTFSGTNTLNLRAGSGSSNVTFAAHSLTRTNNGVLMLNPTSGTTLGAAVGASPSERVTVATGAPTVTNGMVAPYYIDGTTKNFLTYDATNGFQDVTYTKTGTNAMPGSVVAADNVLINESSNNTTLFSSGTSVVLNSLKIANTSGSNGTQTVGGSSDTLSILSGGLILSWTANGGTFTGATFNFGTKEAVVGMFGGGQTISSLVIGSGGFTTYGNSSLTVGNLQTTGGITVAGGSTLLNTGNGVLSYNPYNVLTVDKGGTFGSNANNRPAQMLGLVGEGSVNWSSTTGGSNSGSNAYTIDGLTSTATTTFSGIIQDGFSSNFTLTITKSGLNTQVLTGANTYGGATTVNGGTLRLDFSASGAPTSNIINNVANNSSLTLAGGKLDIIGADGVTNSQQFNNLTVGAGNSSIAVSSGAGGTTNVTLGGGTPTLTRNTGGTINFDLPTSGTVSTTATTFSGNGVLVSGSATGPAFATVNGTDWAKVTGGTIGALTSYDTNDFTASTKNTDITSNQGPAAFTVNTLRFNTAGATLTLTGNNVIGTGGILVTSATSGTGNGVTITGGTNIKSSSGNEMVIINNGQLTVASVIADGSAASALTLSGSGTTTLNGSNTFTGNTYINSGTVVAGHANAFGTAGTVSLNGGTLQSASALTIARAVTLNNNSTISGSNDLTLSGAFINNRNYNTLTVNNSGNTTFSGTFSLGSGNVLNVAGSGNLSVSGVVSTSGGINYAGTGTMTLSNTASTYTGMTTVSSGTLSVGTLAAGGANSSIGAATNVASNIVLDGGTLKYTGATVSTDRLFSVGGSGGALDASGSGAVTFSNAGSIGFANTPGTRTLTLTGTNTDANTLTPIVSDHLGLYATSLTKSGVGKWVLSGANTYTGATTVSAGTLVLAAGGTIAGSSGVNLGTSSSQGTLDLTAKAGGFSLGTGQTLSGYGNVTMASGQTLTVNGGLAPGNSPGVIAISGNLALTSTSTTTMDLIDNTLDAGIGFDQIALSGVTPTLTYDGALTLNVTLSTKLGVYHLFTGFGSNQSGTFTGGINYSLAGAVGTFDYTTGDLNLTAVPEPATWGLLAFSLTTILVLRRRRA